jgi:hypothetical protein
VTETGLVLAVLYVLHEELFAEMRMLFVTVLDWTLPEEM